MALTNPMAAYDVIYCIKNNCVGLLFAVISVSEAYISPGEQRPRGSNKNRSEKEMRRDSSKTRSWREAT